MNNRYVKSVQENWKGMVFMSASALTVAVGQLLWKFSGGTDLVLLVLGFVSYGIGSLLMVVAFKFGKLSVVHPVLSLSYVFGIVLGYVFLCEVLSISQLLAVLLIVTGVVFVGGGDK